MKLLTSTWVVPVGAPPLRGGAVAVESGRIRWVGRPGEPGAPEAPREDLGPGVLLPGLVNAHCHLELSHLRGLARGRGWVDWVEALVLARGEAPRERVRAAAADAIRALEATGTVAVGDVSNLLDHLDLLAASGLRSVVFHELIGWDPARAEAVLADAERRLAAVPPAAGLSLRLAAHAPHSVSGPLLEALARRGGPAAIHLAESPHERRFLERGDPEWEAFLARRGLGHVAFAPPGVSPVRHVEAAGALHPGLVAAHCVQVDAADRGLLARRGVHAVLCPRSNLRLGVGLPPLPELLRDGVRLAVGTDSLASVDSLDLMEDVRLLHRSFPEVPAPALVEMATRGGAAALGLGDLGVLAAERSAALAHAPAERPPEDPYAFLLSERARLRRVA